MEKETKSMTMNYVVYVLIGMVLMLLLIASGYGIYKFFADKTPTMINQTTEEKKDNDNTGTDTTTDSDTGGTITPTETKTTTKVYFYKSPLDYYRNVDDVVSFDRETTDTNVNIIQFTMDQYLKGPNATEKADGYVLPFTLSGISTCAGGAYKYVVSGATTLKLTICKDINPKSDGSGYAGSGIAAEGRVLKSIISTMTVGKITKVEVYDKLGVCYGVDTGQNNCL